MSLPGLRPADAGRGARRAGWTLAGLPLLLTGPSGTGRAPSGGDVTARLGPITVTATAWRPGLSGALTASVQVTTSGQTTDQLDAAIAAGGAPVAVYHQLVSAGEVPDLASCGGDMPPPVVLDNWLLYGPLTVLGHYVGLSLLADATLTVQPVTPMPAGRTLAITLYFAHAGPLTLHLPVAT